MTDDIDMPKPNLLSFFFKCYLHTPKTAFPLQKDRFSNNFAVKIPQAVYQMVNHQLTTKLFLLHRKSDVRKILGYSMSTLRYFHCKTVQKRPRRNMSTRNQILANMKMIFCFFEIWRFEFRNPFGKCLWQRYRWHTKKSTTLLIIAHRTLFVALPSMNCGILIKKIPSYEKIYFKYHTKFFIVGQILATKSAPIAFKWLFVIWKKFKFEIECAPERDWNAIMYSLHIPYPLCFQNAWWSRFHGRNFCMKWKQMNSVKEMTWFPFRWSHKTWLH